MPATIIATVGASNANSFGTLAEATAYFETVLHPDAEWPTTEAVQIPALIMAQQQMTALITWTGEAATITQVLPWPRSGMYTRNDVYIASTVIPDEVKWTQFELARLLANVDRTVEFEVGATGLVQLKAGSVSLRFREFERNPGPPVIPSAAWNLLVPSWYVDISGIWTGIRDLLRA